MWLVVTRPGLAEAVKPLAEFRSAEGYETKVSTQPIEKALAEAGRAPATLLLVGDDQPGQQTQDWYVPAKRVTHYRWRSNQPREFASDMAWGDTHGDGVPEFPVGRIPARTAKEVEQVVAKTLAFERRAAREDDLRLPVWAGSAAYGGPASDVLATHMLLGMIRVKTPDWAVPWIIASDANHSLCGWPADQPGQYARQIQRGGVLLCMIGHAGRTHFYGMTHQGRTIAFTAEHARTELAQGAPAAPMVIIACLAGDFTGPQSCLAETLLASPAGPVAIIAATTESHPLPNFHSGTCCLQELGGKEKRIGALWLGAQRSMLKTRNFLVDGVLRDVEGDLGETIDADRLKADQILLYTLLGDPATKLKLPATMEAAAARNGSGWSWKVDAPAGTTRVVAGYRPVNVELPAAGTERKEDQARAAFEKANAAYAYAPAVTSGQGATWTGTSAKDGLVRLLATGPGVFHVAVLRLVTPATAPTENAGRTALPAR